MKRIIFFVFGLMIFFAGCKSKQMTAVETSEQERAEMAFEREPASLEVESDARIRAVEERFSFTREQDKNLHDAHPFFVIIGSFRNKNNAERYTQELLAKGFEPVILLSETGLHRVSVNSYMLESEARQRIMQIRNDFSEHSDTWLLIRK